MSRPSLNEVGLRHAEVAALRSTCSRLSVGAIITDWRGVILSSGYNGSLSGQPHCVHTDDLSCTVALHAEENAILWAAREGRNIDTGYMYCTHAPCYRCARMIVQSGIERVFYRSDYRGDGIDLLLQSGVSVAKVCPHPSHDDPYVTQKVEHV